MVYNSNNSKWSEYLRPNGDFIEENGTHMQRDTYWMSWGKIHSFTASPRFHIFPIVLWHRSISHENFLHSIIIINLLPCYTSYADHIALFTAMCVQTVLCILFVDVIKVYDITSSLWKNLGTVTNESLILACFELLLASLVARPIDINSLYGHSCVVFPVHTGGWMSSLALIHRKPSFFQIQPSNIFTCFYKICKY